MSELELLEKTLEQENAIPLDVKVDGEVGYDWWDYKKVIKQLELDKNLPNHSRLKVGTVVYCFTGAAILVKAYNSKGEPWNHWVFILDYDYVLPPEGYISTENVGDILE